MTVKERTEKTIKELVSRRAQKNKVLECALSGMAVERCYKAKKELMPCGGD